MSFFNGHNHTDYSNIRGLDCICKVNKLIDYAIDLGLSGIAITDHETVSSHVKAMKYLEEKKEKARKAKEKLGDSEDTSYYDRIESFKLGLGNEIYLCRDGLNKNNYVKGEDGFWHFILIAKDKVGHKQIRELSSRAWARTFRQFIERVPTYYSDIEEIIGENKGHVIASTACLGSQFDKFILNRQYDKALNFVNWCKSIFGEDFYIELQPGTSEEQIAFNSLCYSFAKEHNLKTIITTDTHYLKKEDRPVHKAYLNSNDSEREIDAFYTDTYLMSETEICEKMSYLDQEFLKNCFKNTMSICDSIEEYNLAHKQIVPRIPLNCVSTNEDTGYESVDKFLHSPFEEDRFFINECLDKMKSLQLTDEEHFKRLDAECNEMWIVSEKIEERLSAYFITVRKIIDIAWTDGDSLVGPWRGSVGAMLTAYLMDIIQRDPLLSPSELPYWRFCSRGRAELAD